MHRHDQPLPCLYCAGNPDLYFGSATSSAVDPWWLVDLGVAVPLAAVEITAVEGTGALVGYELRVTNDTVATGAEGQLLVAAGGQGCGKVWCCGLGCGSGVAVRWALWAEPLVRGRVAGWCSCILVSLNPSHHAGCSCMCRRRKFNMADLPHLCALLPCPCTVPCSLHAPGAPRRHGACGGAALRALRPPAAAAAAQRPRRHTAAAGAGGRGGKRNAAAG